VPDQHLGRFVEERTGKELILWPGYCPSHAVITVEGIEAARKEHPGAVVISHPECREEVKEVSDELLSTGQMMKFVEKSEAGSFIVGTETGMIHALRKVRPDAEFVAASSRAICPNMKKITVEKIITSLEQMRYKVVVEESVAARARQALERMIGILPAK
jgi:quinolinate synthase